MTFPVRSLTRLGLLPLAVVVSNSSCTKTLFQGSQSNEPSKRPNEESPNELDPGKNGGKSQISPNELDANGKPKSGDLPGSGGGGGAVFGSGGTLNAGGTNKDILDAQTGTGTNQTGGAGTYPTGTPSAGSGTELDQGTGSTTGTGTTGGTGTGTTTGTGTGTSDGTTTSPNEDPFPSNQTTPPSGWDGSSTPCGPRFQTVTSSTGTSVQVDVGYHPITPVVIVRQDPKDSLCVTYVRATTTSSGGVTSTTLVREGQGLRFAKGNTEVSPSNPVRYCQDTAKGLAVGAGGTPFAYVSPSPASGALAVAAPATGVCIARKTNGAGAPSSDLSYFILIP